MPAPLEVRDQMFQRKQVKTLTQAGQSSGTTTGTRPRCLPAHTEKRNPLPPIGPGNRAVGK